MGEEGVGRRPSGGDVWDGENAAATCVGHDQKHTLPERSW